MPRDASRCLEMPGDAYVARATHQTVETTSDTDAKDGRDARRGEGCALLTISVWTALWAVVLPTAVATSRCSQASGDARPVEIIILSAAPPRDGVLAALAECVPVGSPDDASPAPPYSEANQVCRIATLP